MELLKNDFSSNYNSKDFPYITTAQPHYCYHDMEALSTLLSLCEGNPPVIGGFPSQRDSNVDIWFLLLLV